MTFASSVNIIDENGNVTEQFFPTTQFAVRVDGVRYSPVVTQNVEIESDGEDTSTSDQCGNTERARTGDSGWKIRIQGIVTGNESRQGNLSLQLLRDVVAKSDTIWIQTDVITGTFVVRNTVITQQSDIVSIQTEDTDGEEKAFSFQLQVGEEESE